MKIRIAGQVEESIVDGPGIRYVVFTQGCPHHCLGCHNPSTHDFNGGMIVDTSSIIEEFKKHPYNTGLTISGGEPFIQSAEVNELVKAYHELYPRKNIVIFTGFLYEDLVKKASHDINQILSTADYLIDGKFELSKRDLSLKFKGSTNQRIIDLKKSNISNIVIKNF